MDNDKLFTTPSALTWQLNSAQPTNHLAPPCYLNLNWDQSMDHNTQFESALSSVVSSPSSAPPAAESVVIRELIGRLGSICNSGEISPTSRYHCTNTSGYNTPLSSPPKLNLSMLDPHQQIRGGLRPLPTAHLSPFSADPGFAERAARFSSLGGGRSYSQFGLQEAGKLSRVSSSQALNGSSVFQMGGASDSGNDIQMQDGSQLEMDNAEFGSGSREDSSASERITTGGEAGVRGASGENNARKRKAAPKAKGKHPSTPKVVMVADEEDFNQKRCKSSSPVDGEDKDAIRPKAEKDVVDKKQKKETNGNLPEPPKDYIHVRARRGQATDSHSLAERVRREKISERMKFLQDLVPGCNKVTGKAVMLDEIINYVQSLQKQVEFLSMKLANVNPRLEFNMENFIPKEMNQAHGLYPLESTSTGFSYAHQPQGISLQSMVTNRLQAQYSANPLESGLRPSLIPHLDGFGDAASQLGAFWEDDLQTVVQMGFGQNQDAGFSSQSLHGSLSTTHMKVEL